jgi:DNA adenine methylase
MICDMRYPGGKGKCYQRLVNLMPPHSTYIESHLGGGSVLRHKKRAQINIGLDTDPQVISCWRELDLEGCTIVEMDARAYLETYSFIGGELVYADPPYLTHTRRRARVYRHDYSVDDHVALLDVLAKLPCRVMLSGYDSQMYNERLNQWRKVSFAAKTHADVRQECVWLNFDPPHELHDARFIGDSYRERQSVRRRHDRLLRKFDRMPALERRHLLEQLTTRYADETEAL